MLEVDGLVKAFGASMPWMAAPCGWPRARSSASSAPTARARPLFNLVAGALQPTAGTIRFLGEDITALPTDARFHKGLVRTFRSHEFHNLTARENLMMVPPRQPGENLFANWFAAGRCAAEEAVRRRPTTRSPSWNDLTSPTSARATRPAGRRNCLSTGRTMMTDAKLVLLGTSPPPVSTAPAAQARGEDPQPRARLHLHPHRARRDDRSVRLGGVHGRGQVLIQGDFHTVRSDSRVLEAYLARRRPRSSARLPSTTKVEEPREQNCTRRTCDGAPSK